MTEMAVGDVLQLLQSGTVELEGILPWSSNYAFLVRVCDGPVEVGAVYKPQRGERPLWDFPQGTLCRREQAAFVVSEALGWHIVPPTVLREDFAGTAAVPVYVARPSFFTYTRPEAEPLISSLAPKIDPFDVVD